MREGFLTIIVCIVVVLMGFGLLFLAIGLDTIVGPVKPVAPVETVDNSVEKVECDHDWVVTSEYVWYRSQYRNVSKCSRCGEVVK